jgi:hypothetical protein
MPGSLIRFMKIFFGKHTTYNQPTAYY